MSDELMSLEAIENCLQFQGCILFDRLKKLCETAKAAHEWRRKHDDLAITAHTAILDLREENERLREQLRTARAEERERCIRECEKIPGNLLYSSAIRSLKDSES